MRISREWARRGAQVFLGTLLTFASAGALGAQSQTAPKPATQPDQSTPLIRSLEGPDLFRAYCASCHGVDAKGNGPAARDLKAKVANLTVLSKNNKGKFPEARVRKVVMGDDIVAGHGSREMPVWGPIFHQIEWDVDRGNVRLDNLVKYLESIQSLK
ncbi:MAG: cytochrome c [Acidobacteriia bacterium]|nr:cytochrome c [Terriglobia bacterium]